MQKTLKLLIFSLKEFKSRDKKLSRQAKRASRKLTLILDESGLTFSSEESALIKDLIAQCDFIKKVKNPWGDLINSSSLKEELSSISTVFKGINDRLGNPDTNHAYKQRLRACFSITENYFHLIKLIQAQGKKNVHQKEGLIKLMNALIPPFQFLPHQVLFAASCNDLIKTGNLDDVNLTQAAASLEGKYERSTKLLHHTRKTIEAAKDMIYSGIIRETNVTPIIEIDNVIDDMLEGAEKSSQDDISPYESYVHLAEEICRNSKKYFAQPFSSLPPEKRPTEDKNLIAQQAIANLENTLRSSYRPTLFRGGIGYKREDGSTVLIPGREKIMRDTLDLFKKRELNSYHRLACDILNTAIEAEFDTPLFNQRSAETSAFYSNMFETLGINVQASLNSIEQFIMGKDKEYWDTLIHERPSTVGEILSIIQSDKKNPRKKLKEVIQLAQVAAETNGDASLLKWRSPNTENFYACFNYLFIKLDANLIKPALVEDKSMIIEETDSPSMRL